jgi:hypothetical protein
LYGAENCILLKVEKKFPESIEMWYWRRMDKISWTDHVRNEEVLQSQGGKECPTKKEEKEVKASWFAHICVRNAF